jgi:hypothetical protein
MLSELGGGTASSERLLLCARVGVAAGFYGRSHLRALIRNRASDADAIRASFFGVRQLRNGRGGNRPWFG